MRGQESAGRNYGDEVKTFKVNEGLLFPDCDYRGKNIALRFYIGLCRNHKIFLGCLNFFVAVGIHSS